jgi:hypothetical protein
VTGVLGSRRRKHSSRTGPVSCSALRTRLRPRRPRHASRRTPPRPALPPGSSRIPADPANPGPADRRGQGPFRPPGRRADQRGRIPARDRRDHDGPSVAVRVRERLPRRHPARPDSRRRPGRRKPRRCGGRLPHRGRAAPSSCWPPRCVCHWRNWPFPMGCSRVWPGYSRRSPANSARPGSGSTGIPARALRIPPEQLRLSVSGQRGQSKQVSSFDPHQRPIRMLGHTTILSRRVPIHPMPQRSVCRSGPSANRTARVAAYRSTVGPGAVSACGRGPRVIGSVYAQ